MDIAQEIGHGQGGLAKLAVVVEHPSTSIARRFFEPLSTKTAILGGDLAAWFKRASSKLCSDVLMPNED